MRLPFSSIARCLRAKPSPESAAWDAAHGVETARIRRLHGLTTVGTSRGRGHRYEASSPDGFHEAMRALPITHGDFTFVDLGSGKGRCLLMAEEWGFREIIGIEFALELHRSALQNLGRGHHPTIRAVHADAADYELPPGPLVLYVYNPFDAGLLQGILARAVVPRRELHLVLFAGWSFRGVAEECGFVVEGRTPHALLMRARDRQRLGTTLDAAGTET